MSTPEQDKTQLAVWLQAELALEAEGYEAGRREVEDDELVPNPYEAGTTEALAWQRGLLKAFEEL